MCVDQFHLATVTSYLQPCSSDCTHEFPYSSESYRTQIKVLGSLPSGSSTKAWVVCLLRMLAFLGLWLHRSNISFHLPSTLSPSGLRCPFSPVIGILKVMALKACHHPEEPPHCKILNLMGIECLARRDCSLQSLAGQVRWSGLLELKYSAVNWEFSTKEIYFLTYLEASCLPLRCQQIFFAWRPLLHAHGLPLPWVITLSFLNVCHPPRIYEQISLPFF